MDKEPYRILNYLKFTTVEEEIILTGNFRLIVS